MKLRIAALVSIVVLLASAIAADEPGKADAVKKDLQNFQGTWSVLSMDLDGKPLAEERRKKIRLTVKGEDFTFDDGAGKPGVGLYKIDPTKSPPELDIVITKGGEKGKIYLVIYKFEDGKMVQCMALDNKTRPKEFTGTAGSGCALEIWTREKP